MLKRILATVVVVGGVAVAGSAEARDVCGAPSGLNFRSAPSVHANVRTVLDNGEDIDRILRTSSNGKWLKVQVNGRTGWVYRGYTCSEATRRSRGSGSGGNGGGRVGGAIAHWRNPVAGTCVTSDFGPRRRPTRGASSYHQGCDLGAGCGAPVRSAAPGRVVFAGRYGGYGNTIIVAHPDGSRTLYAHLSRINVRTGTRPTANQVIGRVGSTGVSTGCHLHFGLMRGGRFVDPQNYIGQRRCPTTGRSTGARWFRQQ